MKATKDGFSAFMENKPSDVSMADGASSTLKQAIANGR
jgi:hypothetical protein